MSLTTSNSAKITKTEISVPRPRSRKRNIISASDILLESDISNIIINTKAPNIKSANIQYVTFKEDHKCTLEVESSILLDIAQFKVLLGDEPLFYCNRKNGIVNNENYVKNIKILKKSDILYTVSFDLSKELSPAVLNEKQISITIWDIAGNESTFITDEEDGTWSYVDDNIYNVKPLSIECISIDPKTKILDKNIEGTVVVKIINPNVYLSDIVPTIRLTDESIGLINYDSITYVTPKVVTTDLVQATWEFYITGINTSGNVIIEAYLDIDNNDIKDVVKNNTFATSTIGPFIIIEEGRKYKLESYVPKYLKDDLYNDFVLFVQDFLNSSQKSIDTGNYISMLEKIARINNFNDPFKIENSLLQYYQRQYNIEINPILKDYVYYLNHRQDNSIINMETDDE